MFEFGDITTAVDGREITASCLIKQDAAFFRGHFDGIAIMPAVAQMQMLESLIKINRAWHKQVVSGQSIKFFDKINPGQKLDIRLTKTDTDTINFIVKKDSQVFTKGFLQLTEAHNG